MTKQEWLTSKNLELMLNQVESERKKRLFACACVRRVWDKLSEECKKAIEVSELFADGKATEQELFKAKRKTTRPNTVPNAAYYTALQHPSMPHSAAFWTIQVITNRKQERIEQLKLLREIVNPFQQPIQTNTNIIGIATEIYETQNFTLFPVLHDALMDFNCTNQTILNHCFEPVHVRGCWLIDLLLLLN